MGDAGSNPVLTTKKINYDEKLFERFTHLSKWVCGHNVTFKYTKN